MSADTRQKIPVPRRSFLWSLNETSGEILTHVGPTEFTPSANDRIVRANDRGGFEQAPMEARAFVIARDGEYVILSNPIRGDSSDDAPNGSYVPGGNKEKELVLGTKKIIPGPCAFPMWPGQSAEVRTAHKLQANHYLLIEVVGAVDEKAPYYPLVLKSAELSKAVIDAGEQEVVTVDDVSKQNTQHRKLLLGQRIIVQGRHTQLFIPPSGIEIVPPVEEGDTADKSNNDDGTAYLPQSLGEELIKMLAQVREGLSQKQFSVLKNELRHRQDIALAHRAVLLTALDNAFEAQKTGGSSNTRGKNDNRADRVKAPADPYARRAVVLGPKEFCVLFDADGNQRIVKGPARVFPGPHDAFMQRGSKRRVYNAYELAEHQALWLRIVAPISREKLRAHLPASVVLDKERYVAGHEFIVRGEPSVFFPLIEAEVINAQTREPHIGNDHDGVVISAIGIDQKSGIYVRDLRTGMVKMVRGETSHLLDPRSEEHVHRRIPREQWNLWIGHAEPHKRVSDAFVSTPWAVSIVIPNNEACLITSRHGRRVEVGPKVVLLEYEEGLSPLRLSKGPSKDGHTTVTTAMLRVQGGRVADTFDVESADFVKFRVKLGYAGSFSGTTNEERERWFQVEDPIKLLADMARAKLREATQRAKATDILRDFAAIVRNTLLPDGGPLKFVENGMIVESIDVLSVQIADTQLADLFNNVQREAVKRQLQDEQLQRRLESERLRDVVDNEENTLLRLQAYRKADTELADVEAKHRVALETLQRTATRQETQLKADQERSRLALAAELESQRLRAEVLDVDQTKQLERTQARYKAEEAHRAAMAQIEAGYAQSLAEADSTKLRAIQPELVAALYSASDSEVMKAAANNMNLVSLLGGKSPSELFTQLLRGTPLARSVENMQERAAPAAGKDDKAKK